MHAAETFFNALNAARGGVDERSFYPAVAGLFDEVGSWLRPRVRCVMELSDQGAGHPDGGFFTEGQYRKQADDVVRAQLPERGVLEVKPLSMDILEVAKSAQVAKYLDRYGLVLVTTLREYMVVVRGPGGLPLPTERFTLASSEAAFWKLMEHPRVATKVHGERLSEFVRRVLLSQAPLGSPEDVAAFLASYARDARARIDTGASYLSGLDAVRTSLEEGLGLRFEGERGESFFRSTLVQALFYGLFSAWVLWRRKQPAGKPPALFDQDKASRFLHVPVMRKIFREVTEPGFLDDLRLSEVVDWAVAVLNRVDWPLFSAKFEKGDAVQYFYEPFLEAYDPDLRKELGVWYTPPEVVRYMVERVDTILRYELGLPDGLADPDVVILDPCCGTGAYAVEVLRKIAATLTAQGVGGLVGEKVKAAAMSRVFGFEIMPAPYVIAHWQVAALLAELGASFNDGKPATAGVAPVPAERAGIFLTNALTGWNAPSGVKQPLPLHEMEEERQRSSEVKHQKPVLVVIGNPPYNGYAGIGVAGEREMSDAYRTAKRAPQPQGQGLNDLYVRFFRMAERRIVEFSGRGVISFISNYSWLDGLSYTGMRERYLDVFDRIWIDCLNGDKFKTGKVTPDGQPDPSIFSTDTNREGIQVGTAIATLVRRPGARPDGTQADVRFRHIWGKDKRQHLLATAVQDGDSLYEVIEPVAELGLPLMPMATAHDYVRWPLLPDLLPAFSPGVKTSRDQDLISIDLEPLADRMRTYFDPAIPDEVAREKAPGLFVPQRRFRPDMAREFLRKVGLDSGKLVTFAYRPFDVRHLYWHGKAKLLDESRKDLFDASRQGNLFLTSRQKGERTDEGTPFYVTRSLPDWHLTRPGSMCFPLNAARLEALLDSGGDKAATYRPNISKRIREYLSALGCGDLDNDRKWTEAPWFHALAIGSSPAYLVENASALRQDWPRIPLSATSDRLFESADLGRQVAMLLDPEAPVPGVTIGVVRPELRPVAVPAREDGQNLAAGAGDLLVTAGWGHGGRDGVTMPGKGRLRERSPDADEMALAGTVLDGPVLDVFLNDRAYWKGIPLPVWNYTIGGYQVLKKWLSYREKGLLGRGLRIDEVEEFTRIARRLAALVLLVQQLDDNYHEVAKATWTWPVDPPSAAAPVPT